MATRNATKTDRTKTAKAKNPRESSSRRPGPSVRSTLGVAKPTRRRKETPVEQQTQYVGIDLHRRRSVIVRRNQAGETLIQAAA